MKTNILAFICFFLITCNNPKNQVVKTFPNCEAGLMEAGIYELGVVTSIPKIKVPDNSFTVTIDTSFKAENYTPYFVEAIKTIRRVKTDEFETRFKDFNDGKQIVWLINKSHKKILLQTALFDLIAILEAQDLNNIWKPVEYMKPVFDNFQYDYIEIPTNTASFFKVKLPTEGSFKTKFRYKILGEKAFFYSPEFSGKIDPCKFTQDTTETLKKKSMLEKFGNYVN